MIGQPRKRKIIVMGRMCHDAVAGAVWHFLNYILGFEQLGFETYYVEWTDNWVADPNDATNDADFPRVIVENVMRQYGLADRPGRHPGILHGSDRDPVAQHRWLRHVPVLRRQLARARLGRLRRLVL